MRTFALLRGMFYVVVGVGLDWGKPSAPCIFLILLAVIETGYFLKIDSDEEK